MTTRTEIEEQIQCAERELAMRKSAYPKWIRSGRMTQAKADHEIRVMAGIVQTLKKLEGCISASEFYTANPPTDEEEF